jgi:hypothetical protein
MGLFQQLVYKPELIGLMLFFVALFVMMWKKRLPSVDSFGKFIALWDTRGGNIVILSLFSVWAIDLAVRFGYYTMHAIIQSSVYGKPLPADLPSQLLFSYLTTSVGSNFTGALIKTMTGEHPPIPPSANQQPKPQGGENANPNPQQP